MRNCRGSQLEIVDERAARAREPRVRARAALWSPDSGRLEAESLVRALLRRAEAHDAMLLRASVAGMIGTAGQADYSAAKAGVIGLTMAMAKEMAASNVRINCVSPGPTVNDAVAKKPEGFALSPVTQELFKSTGFGRFGAAEDIANLVAFLASDEAAFITGQNYAVCGVMNLGITQYLGA